MPLGLLACALPGDNGQHITKHVADSMSRIEGVKQYVLLQQTSICLKCPVVGMYDVGDHRACFHGSCCIVAGLVNIMHLCLGLKVLGHDRLGTVMDTGFPCQPFTASTEQLK